MKILLLMAVSVALGGAALTAVQADSHLSSVDDQAQWNRHVDQWQKRMNTIHRQMEQIDRTADPAKRQQLLKEHWKVMNEQMLSMRMMGGGMMAHMRGQGHQRRGQHMVDPEQRCQHMHDRMNTMHLMMEQMMQHQHMMMRNNMYRR